jgi:hypothetical protein
MITGSFIALNIGNKDVCTFAAGQIHYQENQKGRFSNQNMIKIKGKTFDGQARA